MSDESAKEKAVSVVGLVGCYSFSHPVWSCALVGDTDLLCDIRRADLGDNRLLQQESQRLTGHRICPKIPILAQEFGLLPYLLGKAGAPADLRAFRS
jgi:hypothetical protein